MQAGKDYLADKPGITTLEQLAEVRKTVAATGRKFADHVFGAARSAFGGVRR